MSGRRSPDWRLLERIVPVIGMMTGILQRSSLLQRTQRPCSEDAGPPYRARGKRCRQQAYCVSL